MKALPGRNRQQPDPRGAEAQRKGLIQKIHIAKNQLGITEDAYRDMLSQNYQVESSLQLNIKQLEDFRRHIWRPRRGKRRPKKSQVQTLREEILSLAANLERGERRLPGLCEKICGVERLEWCHDVKKLKSLLAAARKLLRMEMGR